ncbi:hypothetical protein HDU67_002238 [Dinochytrium kinnereticum]|nr:hypothetical protein HDU67_002238 [Dinochytrium kinnereticum]
MKMPRNEIRSKIDQTDSYPTSWWKSLRLNKLLYSETSCHTPQTEAERSASRHANEAECRENNKLSLSGRVEGFLSSLRSGAADEKRSRARQGLECIVEPVTDEDYSRLEMWEESDWDYVEEATPENLFDLEIDHVEGAGVTEGWQALERLESYEGVEEELVEKEKAIKEADQRRDSGVEELREKRSLEMPIVENSSSGGVRKNPKHDASEGNEKWEEYVEEGAHTYKTEKNPSVTVDSPTIMDTVKAKTEGNELEEEWEQVLSSSEFDVEESMEVSGDAVIVIMEKAVATDCEVEETDLLWNEDDDWDQLSSPFEVESEWDFNEDIGEIDVVDAKDETTDEDLDKEWEHLSSTFKAEGDKAQTDYVEECMAIEPTEKIAVVDETESEEYAIISVSIEVDEGRGHEARVEAEEDVMEPLEEIEGDGDEGDEWEQVISPFQGYEEDEAEAVEEKKEAVTKGGGTNIAGEQEKVKCPPFDDENDMREEGIDTESISISRFKGEAKNQENFSSDKGLAIFSTSDKQLSDEVDTEGPTSGSTSDEYSSLSELNTFSCDYDDGASVTSLDLLIIELQDAPPAKLVTKWAKFFKSSLKIKILKSFTRLFKKPDPSTSTGDPIPSNSPLHVINDGSHLAQPECLYHSFPPILEGANEEAPELRYNNDEETDKGERGMKRFLTYLKRFNCLG